MAISNQIIFIDLRSRNDYYKRPGGVVGALVNGNLGLSFLRGSMGCGNELREEVGLKGTSGNRDYRWASRSALKDFTDDALTISAGSLFQNGPAQMVKADWRRRAQHLCWWNLYAWPRRLLRVGCVKVVSMGNSRRPWVSDLHGLTGV